MRAAAAVHGPSDAHHPGPGGPSDHHRVRPGRPIRTAHAPPFGLNCRDPVLGCHPGDSFGQVTLFTAPSLGPGRQPRFQIPTHPVTQQDVFQRDVVGPIRRPILQRWRRPIGQRLAPVAQIIPINDGGLRPPKAQFMAERFEPRQRAMDLTDLPVIRLNVRSAKSRKQPTPYGGQITDLPGRSVLDEGRSPPLGTLLGCRGRSASRPGPWFSTRHGTTLPLPRGSPWKGPAVNAGGRIAPFNLDPRPGPRQRLRPVTRLATPRETP